MPSFSPVFSLEVEFYVGSFSIHMCLLLNVVITNTCRLPTYGPQDSGLGAAPRTRVALTAVIHFLWVKTIIINCFLREQLSPELKTASG